MTDTPDADRTFSQAAKLEELSERQKQEIDDQSRPNATLIHETIRAEGESELERGAAALAWSALSAGLSLGFSLLVEGKFYSLLPAGPLRDLLSPLGYSVGFVIVVLGRQQLFTENTLTPVLPLIHHRNLATLGRVLRLWLIVLAGNVVGAMLFALALFAAHVFGPAELHAFAVLGHRTMESGFQPTMMRAVYAGWLIALMVWLLPGAEASRLVIIVLITYVVALSGFSHIIAGTVDGTFSVLSGDATWHEFWLRFFAPTLLGNMLGGVTLVAALNYGQVAPEIQVMRASAEK